MAIFREMRTKKAQTPPRKRSVRSIPYWSTEFCSSQRLSHRAFLERGVKRSPRDGECFRPVPTLGIRGTKNPESMFFSGIDPLPFVQGKSTPD